MTDYDHGYSDGYQQARADMHDNVEPMIEVADRFAHRLALYLELVLSDADQPTDKWWNEATQLIGEYRSAMNSIHEKHCPTFMGEPVEHKWTEAEIRAEETPFVYKMEPKKPKREHITDGTPCWCNPEVDYTDPDTGVSVIVHTEPQ